MTACHNKGKLNLTVGTNVTLTVLKMNSAFYSKEICMTDVRTDGLVRSVDKENPKACLERLNIISSICMKFIIYCCFFTANVFS